MKIAVLTSSRADYSIYYPLLKAIQADNTFKLSVIAFGTHLSEKHGHTLDHIITDGFDVPHRLETLPADDSPAAISEAMGKTMIAFSKLWADHTYDMVICLGDRYEMFAACAAGVPFNVKFAHIHGGEETLGAIDNAFRHAISHFSTLHFTASDAYQERVKSLLQKDPGIYNTGALSIDNLKTLPLLSVEAFKEKFGIDLDKPSILITFHPETVSYEKNEAYITELTSALKELNAYQLIITMPNADTMGNMIREKLNAFIAENANATGVESFGTTGYLTCMKYAKLMLGNTSSGFIEAAFFPKWVINLGERQKGRLLTPNIISCAIGKEEILKAVRKTEEQAAPSAGNIYGDGHAAEKILQHIKSYSAGK